MASQSDHRKRVAPSNIRRESCGASMRRVCGGRGALRSLLLLWVVGTAPVIASVGVATHWTPPAVSTSGYEASPSFSPDGRAMYYVAADERFGGWRILRSRCAGGHWRAGEPVEFGAAPPALDADPFVAADGRRIYFVSTRHDPANEDLDIYVVERDGENWGAPERLPPPVSSPASELLPRLDGEGRLYFGSAREGAAGGGDIYVAIENPPGAWVVERVAAPVSTDAHEYEAEVSGDGDTLVVVADRGDRSHLYRYERTASGWRELGRVPARDDVFQVGPRLSPRGERLLFAQAHADRSGELFLIDLVERPVEDWPPRCVP
jgi:hypothetical protein